MFSLEKLQNNAQEVGEKFAHLVTFNNIRGFNGKEVRLSLPTRLRKMDVLGNDVKIIFNEKDVTITFTYAPSDDTVSFLASLMTELKANKRFFNRFKKSNENIKLQFFPQSNTDGSLLTWKNIKLKDLRSVFTHSKYEANLLETSLVFSFSDIVFTYVSESSFIRKEKEEKAKKAIESYLDGAKNYKDELWKEKAVPEAPMGSNLLVEGYKFKNVPDTKFPYIVKEDVDDKEEVVSSEQNEKIDEEVCKTNDSAKSEHEPTKEKPTKRKKSAKKSKK